MGEVHPTFEQLEQPLGHLGAEILGPIGAYFEAAAVSKQYAMLARRHWPIELRPSNIFILGAGMKP